MISTIEHEPSLIQQDMLGDTVEMKFHHWRQTPGGKRVLQIAYAIAAGYARRFKRTGRIVSMKLIWEILRDNIHAICARRRYLKLEPVDGFVLNNNFTSLISRHMVRHKPEWDGLFEFRERHNAE